MRRALVLATLLLAALTVPAAAENPQQRRDSAANPAPPPQPKPNQATVAPSQWGTVGGTLGTQTGQPQWGTRGVAGQPR
jgi:hypothetical protein